MKKLENIPNKEIFTVPDGYFESLPQRIQSRISGTVPERQVSFVFRFKLQYALPVVILLAAGIYWLSVPKAADVDSLLASVQTEDMVAWLSESDMTTEDILTNAGFDNDDLEQIETEVYELYINPEDLDEVLGDMDL